MLSSPQKPGHLGRATQKMVVYILSRVSEYLPLNSKWETPKYSSKHLKL